MHTELNCPGCEFDLSAERQHAHAINGLTKEVQLIKTSFGPRAHAAELERRLRGHDAELLAVKKRLHGVSGDGPQQLWQDLEIRAWVAKPLAIGS